MKNKGITLVKTRNGCAIMEPESRYDVLLNGVKISQLYYNMSGYCGTLPLPDDRHLMLGECPISIWKKEAARLNREVWNKTT
jgi:hypothetical protein